jgi:AcrR family transcriptional regulator
MRRDFHKTTMHEICAQTGMSRGGICPYFASEDAIIVAIMEKRREGSTLIIAVLEGTQDFIE